MVNVRTKLITDSDGGVQGVRNLKTVGRGRKYIAVVLTLLPPKLHNELRSQIDQYLRYNPTPIVIPCRVRAPGAWNLPAVATASACCGVCACTRRLPLHTRCAIR